MKKFFKFAFIMMCAAMSATMTSCNDDNENNKNPQQPIDPTMQKTAYFGYTINVSQDLLDVADVFVYWTDKDGVLQSKELDDIYYTFDVETDGIPATDEIGFTYTLKDDVIFEKEHYTIMTSCTMTGAIIGSTDNGNGEPQTLVTRTYAHQSSKGVEASKLAEYLSDNAFSYTIHVDEKVIDFHYSDKPIAIEE